MKKYFIVAIIFISAIVISGCTNNNTEETNESDISESEKVVNELVSQYNAINIKDLPIYTINIKESLAQKNNQLVFNGYIQDIYEKDDEMYVQFNSGWFPEYFINLKCSLDLLPDGVDEDENTKYLSSLFPDLVIVAEISDVQRPRIQIQGDVDDIESQAVSIEFGAPDTFLLEGECIEIQKVENDY